MNIQTAIREQPASWKTVICGHSVVKKWIIGRGDLFCTSNRLLEEKKNRFFALMMKSRDRTGINWALSSLITWWGVRDLNSVSGEEKRECVATKSRHVSVRRGPANEFTQSGPLRRALDWRACGVDRVCIRGEHNQPGQIPPGSAWGALALLERDPSWLFHFNIKINILQHYNDSCIITLQTTAADLSVRWARVYFV